MNIFPNKMNESRSPTRHFCWEQDHSLLNSTITTTITHIPAALDIVKCVWIVLVTFCIVFFNILMITVLHSRNHFRYLRQQPRLFMTSLAVTDLAVGTLVTPLSIFPSLYHCWPFGNVMCAVEALLISALFHQSTLSLMCVAIDRYVCIVYPLRYYALMTKKVCLTMITVSWIMAFSVYSAMIYPNSQYFFDHVGILTCEPYYANKPIIIMATALFYFPPLVIILYCYITIFRVARRQLKTVQNAPVTITENVLRCEALQNHKNKDKLKNYQTAVTLAAIALGFVIAVTPWTLTELITSCFEVKIEDNVLFSVTWLAISNSFWNPIIYGVMNRSFRKVAIDILHHTFCRNDINRIRIFQNRTSQLRLETF